jgi:phage major head subunit gpT-like protein
MNKSYADAAQIAAAMYGFQTFFDTVFAQFPDPVAALAMEVNSNAGSEEYDWFGDIPGMQEWVGDRALGNLRSDMMRIGNFPFASGVKIKKWDILDDKLGKIAPRISTLAEKAAMTPAYMLGLALLKGHTAVSPTELRDEVCDGNAYDGLSFFNAAHFHEEGSSYTYSNVGTAALAQDSYNAARVIMKSYKGNDGKFSLRINPQTLIVGPTLERTAIEIVRGSIRSDGETSSVGIDNAMRNTADVLVIDAFTGSYADYWCLADLTKSLKPLIFQVRDPVTTSAATNPDNIQAFMRADYLFGAEARWGFGYGAPCMCWGSNGTT